MSALTRQGVVGADSVVFDVERCAGCDGRCAIRLGKRLSWPLSGSVDAPRDAKITLSASASRLVGETLLLFGLPVLCVAVAAFAVETAGPVAVAFAGGVLAALLIRRLLLGEPRTSLTVGESGSGDSGETPAARVPEDC